MDLDFAWCMGINWSIPCVLCLGRLALMNYKEDGILIDEDI